MLYKLKIEGLIWDSPLKIDIPYVADGILDIETMETEYSGFDFELPVSQIPLPYQADELDGIITTTDLEEGALTVDVNSTTGLSVGEHYWAGNELLRVDNISSLTLTLTRGAKGTFENNHWLIPTTGGNIGHNLYKYNKNLKGLRVFLYLNDVLEKIGVIDGIDLDGPVFQINCKDLLYTLEYEIPTANYTNEFNQTHRIKNITEDVLGGVSSFAYFYGKVPPLKDYFDTPHIIEIANDLSIGIDKFKTFKDAFTFYQQMFLVIMVFDKTSGTYKFQRISQSTELDPATDITLYSYKDVNKSIKSELYLGVGSVRIKQPDHRGESQPDVYFELPIITQMGEARNIELDFSDTMNLPFTEMLKIAERYIYQFGIVYSKLTVPSARQKHSDFQIGNYYNATDLLTKFYTFQNVSTRLFCLGFDGDDIAFLVIKQETKNVISTGIPVISDASSTVVFDSANYNLSDFLDTNETTVENAVIPLMNIPYLLANDAIYMKASDDSENVQETVVSISGNSITLSGAPLNTGSFWLFFDNYASVVTRQQPFFYFTEDEY